MLRLVFIVTFLASLVWPPSQMVVDRLATQPHSVQVAGDVGPYGG